MTGLFRRSIAAGAAALLAVSGLVVIATAPPVAASTPGHPGDATLNSPRLVTLLDFEAGYGPTAEMMAEDADPYWKNAPECNGVVVQYDSATFPIGFCDSNPDPGEDVWAQNNVRRFADVLGQVDQGAGSTSATQLNNAVMDWTFNQDNLTNPPQTLAFDSGPFGITPPTAARYYSVSVDVVEGSCDFAVSLLWFSLVSGSTTYSLNADGSPIIPCADDRTEFYSSPDAGLPTACKSPLGPCDVTSLINRDNETWGDGGAEVRAGRYYSNGSVLLTATQVAALSFRINNDSGSSTGNDTAFDNIRILDATPQLDKEFSPTVIAEGGTSTMTFTVTNTSELAEKKDWHFAESLPVGVKIAGTPNFATTCTNVTQDAPAGATDVSFIGTLDIGMESCTISVDVTVVNTTTNTAVNSAGIYYNNGCRDDEDTDNDGMGDYINGCTSTATGGVGLPETGNYTIMDGLNPPGNAKLIVLPQIDLSITKVVMDGSTAVVPDASGMSWYYTPGQPISYRVVVSNAASTAAVPISTATNVDFADVVPASITGVTWTCAASTGGSCATATGTTNNITNTLTIPAGGTVTFNVTGTVVVGTTGDIVNTGQATPPATMTIPSPNCDPATLQAGDSCTNPTVEYDNPTIPNGSGPGPYPANQEMVCTPAPGSGCSAQVTTPSGGSIRIIKDALPNDAQDFAFTATGSGLSGFSLDDDADATLPNEKLFTNLAPGSYSVTETATSGWNQTGLTCTEAGGTNDTATTTAGAVASIEVDSGETVTCTYTNTKLAPNLVVSKEVSPTDGSTVNPGDLLTYTLKFDNSAGTAAATVDHFDDLSKVLDDASVTVAPAVASGPALTVSAITAGKFTVTGSVPAGQTTIVTYTVQVKPAAGLGDKELQNFLVKTGDTPPTDCVDGDPMCTYNPVPKLEVAKDVSPADGSTVTPGQELTYTLTFTNSGAAVAPVDYTDDLAKVLDDAAVTAAPAVASGPALTVSPVAGGEFTVTGSMPAGATTTVTYKVTVKAAADLGDMELQNFLVKTGDTPPSDCVTGDPMCTYNPVPKLEVSKDVAPTDGSTVNPGDLLTYSLTFTNSGAAAAPVDYTDDLSKVLDDANVTIQPAVSSGPALTISAIAAGKFTVTGSLPAGQTTIVMYTVQVKPAADLGDKELQNFLVQTGDTPPSDCVDGDPLCTYNPVPKLEVAKDVSPADGSTVTPGQELTYTLTFTNSGAATATGIDYTDDLSKVLDDADVSSQPVSSDPAQLVASSPIAGDAFTVVGSLGAGETVTITYKVVVKAAADLGDKNLDNFLVKTGDTPPTDCVVGDPLCTHHPVANLSVAKDVSPADGSTVLPGQELTYTLTFTNSGVAAATGIDYTDDLSKVLDDADVSSQPVSSDPAQLVASPISAGAFTVTGSLPAGETVTVTYKVVVKAADDLGDTELLNFLVKTGDTPPTDCVVDDPMCTYNPVPELEVAKDVSPADGATVLPGQELTYTLKFTNTGAGKATGIDYTDDLSKVLDDADVSSQPVSSDPAQLVASPISAGAFTVTGSLGAGETVTITYKVIVKAAADLGDKKLLNFLVKTGDTPPTDCVVDDPMCTYNPVPKLEVAKDVSPADGATVLPGQELTYTLTFKNTGAATVLGVDYTDDLAKVLDDADLIGQPVSSDPSLVVTPSPLAADDTAFTVTGDLAAGATVTVTYTVKVKAAADLGDKELQNFLVQTGDTPPTDCAIGDPLCTYNPVPKLEVAKDVSPADGSTVKPGDVLTYTLTFMNSGAAIASGVDYTDDLSKVLDDATVSSQPVSSDPSLVVTPSPLAAGDTAFTITGWVDPNTTVTVTYTVTVDAAADLGDKNLDNFLVKTGDTPPTDCVVDDPLCTHHPVANLSVSKDVSPADGSTVTPGQELTYTLTFTNSGAATATGIDYTDDLSKVLDDATVSSQPVSSDPAQLVASSPIAGDAFTVVGSLGAGETVTVTYKVVVKAAADLGDKQLQNFLVKTGDTPPTDCVVGDPMCTYNPVPKLEVAKDVSPTDGSTVTPGQELTYTLTFTNTGAATATGIDYTDDLSKVLDDADVSSQPVSSDPVQLVASPISAGAFTVVGSLPAGETVTVTYKVVVKAAADLGDKKLLNFLVQTGDTPPTDCVDGDPMCTYNPVPKLEVAKDVSPTDGSPVVSGQELTYTLTFENSGAAAATGIDYTDDLTAVLDDADLTGQPVVTGAGLTVTPSPLAATDTSFTITGTVAANTTVTVTYKVTVKAAADLGDTNLDNFLFQTTDGPPPPGTVCAAGDPMCTHHPVPRLEVSKDVDPIDGSAVTPGAVLTYTLTFNNSGAATATGIDYTDDLSKVLDDATVTIDPASSDPSLVLDPTPLGAATSFTVQGSVAANTTVTVTYTVTVDAAADLGDKNLDNFLVKTGDTPPTDCVVGDPLCTHHPVANLAVTKSVNPETGTTVNPGDELTYTLTFANNGAAAATGIDYTDDLSKVLDDADLTGQPVVNGAGLTVTPSPLAVTDMSFTITGQVAAGDTVTVVYTVTVKAAADLGDTKLDNFLVKTGDTPPEECLAPDALCTHNPVPKLEVAKDVSPADGSTVNPGDVLTYTLTFANSGAAAATGIDYIDDLSKVLDDATITMEPVSSDASLTVTPSPLAGATTFTIIGEVAADTTVTVTYSVTVKAAGDLGDMKLDNFLVKTGDTPPTDCVAGDPLCTHNPVPKLEVAKDVSPADGSTVTPGDVLTYTLTFKNSGAAPATGIDYTDDLSKVLDDADLTGQPVVNGAGLTVTPLPLAATDTSFTITGQVAAGDTVTVVYTVTVKAAADLGDTKLDNFLVKTGDNPPTDCAATDPLCTHNPVPNLRVVKSVDPVTGSTVSPGQVLTYTLMFSNSGAAAASVDYFDDLTKVLDDATMTTQPAVASGTGVTATSPVTDGRFAVTGTVAAGGTVTVTYQVTVKTSGFGDLALDNYLVKTGDTPPPDCVPAAAMFVGAFAAYPDPELCTHNPVVQHPKLDLVKSVDKPTVATAGETVVYTFHVTNTGDVDLTDINISESVFTGTNGPLVVTCPSGTLAVGASTDCSAPYVVSQADIDTGVVHNTAVAHGTPPSGPPVDSPPSTAVVTAEQVASISIVKATTTTEVTSVGQVVPYTFVVTNTGNVTLSKVTVTDTVQAPAAQGNLGPITCGSTGIANGSVTLVPGESITCAADYTVAAADLASPMVTNTATATGAPPTGVPVVSPPSVVEVPVVVPPAPTSTSTSPTPTTTVEPSESSSSEPPVGWSPPLANTGVALLTPMLIGGAVLVALGGFLMVFGRRRRKGQHAG